MCWIKCLNLRDQNLWSFQAWESIWLLLCRWVFKIPVWIKILCLTLSLIVTPHKNRLDPDQQVPIGTVWSESALFAYWNIADKGPYCQKQFTSLLAHLTTKCSWWVTVIGHCPSSGVNNLLKWLLLLNHLAKFIST